MVGLVLGGIALAVTGSLYCCIRVGALEDRQLEELHRREKQKAGDYHTGRS